MRYIALNLPLLDVKLNANEKLVVARLAFLTNNGEAETVFTTNDAIRDLSISHEGLRTTLNSLAEKNLLSIRIEMRAFKKFRVITLNLPQNAMQENGLSDTPIFCENQENGTCKGRETAFLPYPNYIYNNICNINNKKNLNSAFAIPKNAKECENYFYTYIEKYKNDNPLLENLDVVSLSQNFFDYWSNGDWKDNKGNPVKNVARRVATWIANSLESEKRKEKSSTKKRKRNTDYNSVAERLAQRMTGSNVNHGELPYD